MAGISQRSRTNESATAASRALKSKAATRPTRAAASPPSSAGASPASRLVFLILLALVALLALYWALSFLIQRQDDLALRELEGRLAVARVQHPQARQAELNRGSKDQWGLYTEHRGNVTQAIRDLLQRTERAGVKEPSLVILGAGNLNDVTLRSILRDVEAEEDTEDGSGLVVSSRGFARMDIVDIDEPSMHAGFARQANRWRSRSVQAPEGMDPLTSPTLKISRITVLQADVTGGAFDTFHAWKRGQVRALATADRDDITASATAADDLAKVSVPRSPSPSVVEVEKWAVGVLVRSGMSSSYGFPASPFLRPPGLPSPSSDRFSVAVSLCLLSQILDSYLSVVGETHPRFRLGSLALREAHLALLVDLLVPGGWGILITDVVAASSLPTPSLRQASHEELPRILLDLASNTSLVTNSIHPIVIRDLLRSRFGKRLRKGSIHTLAPWKWRVGGGEHLLVTATVFQKM